MGLTAAELEDRTKRVLERTKKLADKDPEGMEFDRENAFQTYASLLGDLNKTAHALKIEPERLLRVVDYERWDERLATLIKLRESASPADIERGINRAMNFVQAHRMRLIVEKMIRKMYAMTPEQLEEYVMTDRTVTRKDGSVVNEKFFNTRPFADLASAMEKVHAMTYQALNDNVPERIARDKGKPSDKPSAGEIHKAIAEAMSKAGAASPQGLLLDEHLARVEIATQQVEAEQQLAKELGPAMAGKPKP